LRKRRYRTNKDRERQGIKDKKMEFRPLKKSSKIKRENKNFDSVK
jgi:hypothetical protein